MQIKVTRLPGSVVEIEGELEAELFESYFAKALKKIGEKVELPGFRKGKVPENILLSKVSEIRILEEMAEMALSEHYPKIIEDQKIDAISRPDISITKLARKNPLGFKIKTAVLPEIKLADYKTIAKKIISKITDAEKNIVVTDEDLENTIMDIRKSRAPKVHMADATTSPLPSPKERGEEAPSLLGKAGDGVENQPHPNPLLKGEGELPDFNDEFVQALGPFTDVVDFKNKLKENIKLEKENGQKEKTRLKIIEKILEIK